MGKLVTLTVTPVISTSAYTSGDALGGKFTLSGAANGGKSTLKSIVLRDKSNQKIACDLLLFKADFTETADNAAIAVSAADLLNLVGHVSLVAGDFISVSGSARAVATKTAINLPVSSADNNIYAQFVTRGTPTYAAVSDLQAEMTFELDV
jgi:hypothetical protein